MGGFLTAGFTPAVGEVFQRTLEPFFGPLILYAQYAGDLPDGVPLKILQLEDAPVQLWQLIQRLAELFLLLPAANVVLGTLGEPDSQPLLLIFPPSADGFSFGDSGQISPQAPFCRIEPFPLQIKIRKGVLHTGPDILRAVQPLGSGEAHRIAVQLFQKGQTPDRIGFQQLQQQRFIHMFHFLSSPNWGFGRKRGHKKEKI